MPRDLRALPGPHVRVELVPELRDFLPDAFQLHLRLRTSRQLAEFLDVFLQAFYLRLPVGGNAGRLGFVFCGHPVTVSTDCSPQILRASSASSGDTFTFCCACNSATEPSGDRNSNTTGQEPGELTKRFSK